MAEMTELPLHLAHDPLAMSLAQDGEPLGRICAVVERAAIMEHDGKVLRWKSEALAQRQNPKGNPC